MRVAKLFFKLLFVLAFLFLIGLALLVYKSRAMFTDTITIEGFFLMNACGENCLDIEIRKIKPEKYQYIVGETIDPYQPSKTELENIISGGYRSGQSTFCLVGKLHKHKHGFWIFATDSYDFYTESIKSGKCD